MPLAGTEAILGKSVKSAIDSVADKDDTEEVWTKIGKAIIDHIVANAVNVPTTYVAPSGGGPVIGAGNIT